MPRRARDQRSNVPLGKSDLPEDLPTSSREDCPDIRKKYSLTDALSHGSAQCLFDLSNLFGHGWLRDIEGGRYLRDLLEVRQRN
jgi:hypothetical protein